MNLGDLILALYAQQSPDPQVSPWLDPRYYMGQEAQPNTPVLPVPDHAQNIPRMVPSPRPMLPYHDNPNNVIDPPVIPIWPPRHMFTR
jgi:hypothetical protein